MPTTEDQRVTCREVLLNAFHFLGLAAEEIQNRLEEDIARPHKSIPDISDACVDAFLSSYSFCYVKSALRKGENHPAEVVTLFEELLRVGNDFAHLVNSLNEAQRSASVWERFVDYITIEGVPRQRVDARTVELRTVEPLTDVLLQLIIQRCESAQSDAVRIYRNPPTGPPQVQPFPP